MMKTLNKIIILLTMLITFSAGSSFAQSDLATDRLYVKSININTETTVTLDFILDNTTTFYGFQANVVLPEGLEFVTDNQGKADVSLDPSRTAGGDYECLTNIKNGVLHIAAFSSSNPQKAIIGSSGTIFTLTVRATEAFRAGDVNISGIRCVDSENKDVKLSDTDSYLGVLPISVTLSNHILVFNEPGETETLTTEIDPSNAAIKTLTWSSDKTEFATVDQNGKVTAEKRGSATIEVRTVNDKTDACVVVVGQPANKIEILNDYIELYVGGKEVIKAEVGPWDAENKEVRWSSDLNDVAIVDQDGNVTALALGKAIITAQAIGGVDVVATCTVNVIPTPAEKVIVTPPTARLMLGQALKLEAEVLPETTTYKDVTWASSNPAVASVDEDGNVTLLALGETTISATCGNAVGTSTVTVIPIPVTSIYLDKETLILKEGDTGEIIATVLPEDAADKTVTWTSSDPSIATVDANGKVTALDDGEATITATSGNVSATCLVTVLRNYIEPTRITLSNYELLMRETYTSDLIAIIDPENVSDNTVTWSTSDPTIAVVDNNGVVTAIKAGLAMITAATVNGLTANCYVTVVPLVIPVESITLNRSAIEISVDEVFKLNATVLPEDATDTSVRWVSNDRAIATVTQDGEVTGIAEGTTIIYASSSNGLTAECEVTVKPLVIEPSSLTLTNTELFLIEGETADLIPIIRPEEANFNTAITWTSSDESIATVDQNGIVTAIHQGFATITATTANGKIATCAVTVTIIAVESISLNKNTLEMIVDDKETLIATITPDNATDKSVTWRSSNREVATVSENGLVTAVGVGTATIYASSSNGLTDVCDVTVNPGFVPVESISLSNTQLLMRAGYSTDLIAIVRPDNATDKSVTWTVDDESIVSFNLNEDGVAILTAHAVGSAIITVTSNSAPTVKAQCFITVEKAEDITAVTTITLNKTELTLTEGETFDLIATIEPANATDKSVTWKSSDKEVATVDENGKVTAVKMGTATIYASSSNGMTVECALTVIPADVEVQSISLTNTELLMRKGRQSDLIAIIRPDNATNKSVIWSSDDESIVTVDQNGIVTAIELGTATVTASSHNGKKATCFVTVVPDAVPVESITVDPTSLEMEENDFYTLIATVLPADATDKSVTWKSSNREIASVTENGMVIAHSVGTVTIYASSSNGLTAECAVTVKPDVVDQDIEVVSISLTNTELLMIEGDVTNLMAIIRPDDATDKSVTWSSDNEEIATVDNEGNVTAIKVGNATITATATNGVYAQCFVTVMPLIIAVESISISDSEIDLFVNDTYQLTATITPEDVTDNKITWKSLRREIATVSENGLVTAVGEGQTIIYASSSNGLTAECIVNVIANDRPETPRQLLKKGDGSTCTFIVMMDLPNDQLTELGYRYVFGYYDANGDSHVIEETPLRYTHTSSEIYNDSSNDFWVFALIENSDGALRCSNLRHLDGSEEVCYDASKFGYATRGASDEWIKITPKSISIRSNTSEETQIAIYTMTGLQVFSKTYSAQTGVNDTIEFLQFTPDAYLLVAKRGEEAVTKKIVIR